MYCAAACPEGIIVSGSGFPRIDFSTGECTFCQACVEACPAAALGPAVDDRGAARRPWALEVRISDLCLAAKGVVCRICQAKCEAGAFAFPHPSGLGRPRVRSAACTECGACVAPCPAGAISLVAA